MTVKKSDSTAETMDSILKQEFNLTSALTDETPTGSNGTQSVTNLVEALKHVKVKLIFMATEDV